MKHIVQSAIQQVFVDRRLLAILAAILTGGVAYIIYVSLSLSASDLQLAIRYTSFGETHFYRERWWYLLSFVGFGIVFIIAHIGMVVKLAVIGFRQLAFGFAWLSLIVLLIMFAYTYYILGIAYLN